MAARLSRYHEPHADSPSRRDVARCVEEAYVDLTIERARRGDTTKNAAAVPVKGAAGFELVGATEGS
jgi:hypothetical protein